MPSFNRKVVYSLVQVLLQYLTGITKEDAAMCNSILDVLYMLQNDAVVIASTMHAAVCQ